MDLLRVAQFRTLNANLCSDGGWDWSQSLTTPTAPQRGPHCTRWAWLWCTSLWIPIGISPLLSSALAICQRKLWIKPLGEIVQKIYDVLSLLVKLAFSAVEVTTDNPPSHSHMPKVCDHKIAQIPVRLNGYKNYRPRDDGTLRRV